MSRSTRSSSQRGANRATGSGAAGASSHAPGSDDTTSVIDRLKTGSLKDETDPLFHVRDAAIGAGVLAGIGVFCQKKIVEGQLENLLNGTPDFNFLGQAATLAALLYLTVRWYYHGTEELRHLQFWLRPARYHAAHPIAQYFAIIAVGVFMAVLGIFDDKILVFSLVFTVYLAGDLLSWKLRRAEIESAIARSRSAIAKMTAALAARGPRSLDDRRTLEVYSKGADHLDHFYFRHPHYTRLIVEITLMAIVCACVITLRLADTHAQRFPHLVKVVDAFTTWFLPQNVTEVRLRLRELFYVFFIVLLLTGEHVIGRWRATLHAELVKLDDALDSIDDEAELGRIQLKH